MKRSEQANMIVSTLQADGSSLMGLVALVRRHTGQDFSGYKPETLLRRAQARMVKLKQDSMAAYLEVVRREPAEAAVLRDHFLVSLSSFFRDADSFEALRGFLPQAVARGEEFLVWVPACATGEEVYSLAILLAETMGAGGAKVKLVGCDLNTEALRVASNGTYPASAVEALGSDRVRAHFEPTGNGYRVREALREMCTFRCHDVIGAEAPSGIGLISCRNLLIYLRTGQQGQLIAKLHKALHPEGLLFIGPAETLGSTGTSLFRTLDATHRIFRRRPDRQGERH